MLKMWTGRTRSVWMSSEDRTHKHTVKLQRTSIERQTLGHGRPIQSLTELNQQIPGLMGEQHIIHVNINGVNTKALLDTGATVCTIYTDFYNSYLQDVPLHLLDDIVKIKCADGGNMPYLGYIKVTVSTEDINSPNTNDCLMLVVPTTDYSKKVPAITGTHFIKNVMNCVKQQNGERFLQNTQMKTTWYLAFRCVALQEKERNRIILGIVKSAETHSIIIPPNKEVTITGFIDRQIPYQPVCAVLQKTNKSVIPDDLDISPS